MPVLNDPRERELDPTPVPVPTETLTSSPFAFLSSGAARLDPVNLTELDPAHVNPIIARSLIETLHAAIVLYDSRAEPKEAKGGPGKETITERLAREHCYARRLAAARSMAYITRQVGDVSKIYVPMCIAVSLPFHRFPPPNPRLTCSRSSSQPPFCQSANVIIKELRRSSPLSVIYSTNSCEGPSNTTLPICSAVYTGQLKLDLEALMGAVERLGPFFPGLSESYPVSLYGFGDMGDADVYFIESYVDGVRRVYLASLTPAATTS